MALRDVFTSESSVRLGGLIWYIDWFAFMIFTNLYLLLFDLWLLLTLEGYFQLQRLRGKFIRPVINIVHLNFVAFASSRQQSFQVLVIRFFFKLESFGIIDEESELIWEAFTEEFSRGRDLLLHNHFILGFCILCLHILPREYSPQEIHHYISNGLDVVPTRLLDPHVGINTCVSCCSRQFLPLFVGNMLVFIAEYLLSCMNRLESPKSTMYTVCAFLPTPIRKLSGLMSLWRIFFSCSN